MRGQRIIARLKGEIQKVIETVKAQGRELENQKAAAIQQAAQTPGDQNCPGEQGNDGSTHSQARLATGTLPKVRRAGGRSDADVDACKKLAMDKAAKKALKENGGAVDSGAGVAGAGDSNRTSP